MKKWLQSYSSFTRTERAGILGLLLLLVVLIAVRLTMPYWYDHSKTDTATYPQLPASWGAFQKQQPGANEYVVETVADTGQYQQEQQQLTYFDPNTADSSQLLKLGFSTFQTRNLLKWRTKGKRFYKPQDLRPLYGMTGEQYNRLAHYIRIDARAGLKKIDLNTADSMDLIRIRGIGPRLAHRILERRREIGRYTRHAQLLEVYHFSDSMYRQLQEQLVITQ